MHDTDSPFAGPDILTLAQQTFKAMAENSAWKPFTTPAPELPAAFKHRIKKLNRLRTTKAGSLSRAREDYKYQF